MKQQVGAFCYHFWTHAVPRLNRYQKQDSGNPLVQVKDHHDRQRIIKTLKAEGYVMFSNIAMGIIQILCLRYQGDIQVSSFRYLRTPSCRIMSEASMMAYIWQNLFRFMALRGSLMKYTLLDTPKNHNVIMRLTAA